MKRIKQIKQAVAVMAAVICVLSMTACSNKGTQIPAAEETSGQVAGGTKEPEEEPVKVGIGIYKFDDDFMTLYRTELEKYLSSEYQAEVLVRDAKGDQKRQNDQIEALIQEECDVLILNLVQASETKTVADKCSIAGIPVVFINREPDEAEIRRWKEEKITASYVGADARQSGTFQGEIILETPNKGDFDGDGMVSYVMIQGDEESIDAEYRTRYSVQALKKGGMKTRELFCQRGNWEEDRGRELVSAALNHYGDQIEVVFCNNDAMANGARTAIESAGRTVGKDIYLVGVDALEETVGYVKDGGVTGTVWNDYVKQSHTAADVAIKMAAGEKVDTKYTVDHVKIVSESAAEDTDQAIGETETDIWEPGETAENISVEDISVEDTSAVSGS